MSSIFHFLTKTLTHIKNEIMRQIIFRHSLANRLANPCQTLDTVWKDPVTIYFKQKWRIKRDPTQREKKQKEESFIPRQNLEKFIKIQKRANWSICRFNIFLFSHFLKRKKIFFKQNNRKYILTVENSSWKFYAVFPYFASDYYLHFRIYMFLFFFLFYQCESEWSFLWGKYNTKRHELKTHTQMKQLQLWKNI